MFKLCLTFSYHIVEIYFIKYSSQSSDKANNLTPVVFFSYQTGTIYTNKCKMQTFKVLYHFRPLDQLVPTMATNRADITSDEYISIKCVPCAEENRIVQADKYCILCNVYYCLPCADMHHRRFTELTKHKLLDISDVESLPSDGSLPSVSIQRCSLHPTKIVDMFCEKHDEVACASCITLSHR